MSENEDNKLLPLSKNDFRKIIGKNEEEDKNKNIVSLIISGFMEVPELITKKLNLLPTKTQISGNSYDIQFGEKTITRVAEENLWMYEERELTDEFISDQVETFISEIIKPRSELLFDISKSADISLQIVQYYYTGCNPGYFLSKAMINSLSEINAEVDIDCYCLSDDDED